ncbi:beta-1,4-galactosyltransferase galt-1-like [Oculina patagonica]
MTRRKAKRLLKKACMFVGVGIVMLSPLFLLPDLNSQPKNKYKLDSHMHVKESRHEMTAKQTGPQNEYTTSLPKASDAIKEDPAPDNFFPPQISHFESCASNREAEKLQFHELLEESVIYSAFLDYRFKEQSFIRMISILPSYGEPTQMYCHFMDLRTQEYFTSVVEIEELGTNQGYPFQGFLSSCDLPEEIDSYTLCSVNISVEPEAYRQTDKNTKEIPLHVLDPHGLDHRVNMETYGLCVPPITGEISVTRLVEFIELSHILGVTHFTFYDSKSSEKTKKILRYYTEKGLLTVYPWDLPHYISSNIQDNGQTAALNDCLYRNMGQFAYVAFNDLDEFIAPLQKKSTLQIFETVKDEDTAGYCFQFFSFDTSKSVAKNLKTQLYTQRFTSRTKAPVDHLSRCITSPKKVFSLDLNTISNPARTYYTTRHVEPSFGHVFHYGECNNREWDCGDSREDNTMEKYRKELEMRFNATMSYLRHYGLA